MHHAWDFGPTAKSQISCMMPFTVSSWATWPNELEDKLAEAAFEEFSGRWGCKGRTRACFLSLLCSPSLSSAAVCLLLRAELHWEPGWLGGLMFAFTCTFLCSMVRNYIVSCNGVDTRYVAGPRPFWSSLWSCCFWTKLGSFKVLLFHTKRKTMVHWHWLGGVYNDSARSTKMLAWSSLWLSSSDYLPKPRPAPLSSAVTFWSGSLHVVCYGVRFSFCNDAGNQSVCIDLFVPRGSLSTLYYDI